MRFTRTEGITGVDVTMVVGYGLMLELFIFFAILTYNIGHITYEVGQYVRANFGFS